MKWDERFAGNLIAHAEDDWRVALFVVESPSKDGWMLVSPEFDSSTHYPVTAHSTITRLSYRVGTVTDLRTIESGAGHKIVTGDLALYDPVEHLTRPLALHAQFDGGTWEYQEHPDPAYPFYEIVVMRGMVLKSFYLDDSGKWSWKVRAGS